MPGGASPGCAWPGCVPAAVEGVADGVVSLGDAHAPLAVTIARRSAGLTPRARAVNVDMFTSLLLPRIQVARHNQLERELVGRVGESYAGTEFHVPRFSRAIDHTIQLVRGIVA